MSRTLRRIIRVNFLSVVVISSLAAGCATDADDVVVTDADALTLEVCSPNTDLADDRLVCDTIRDGRLHVLRHRDSDVARDGADVCDRLGDERIADRIWIRLANYCYSFGREGDAAPRCDAEITREGRVCVTRDEYPVWVRAERDTVDPRGPSCDRDDHCLTDEFCLRSDAECVAQYDRIGDARSETDATSDRRRDAFNNDRLSDRVSDRRGSDRVRDYLSDRLRDHRTSDRTDRDSDRARD